MDSLKEFFIKYRHFIIICFIFISGIFFRFEAYIIERMFDFDEAQLVYNITENSGILWAFRPLENYQIAPPLFLIATKFLTIIFNESEFAFRLIPFAASTLSIFVFYIFSKKVLSKERSIIFANFLFAINFTLAAYAVEFKQYSIDVLAFMLILMYAAKINLQKIDFKGGIKLALIFTILFFISQPTIFLLFGLVLYYFIKTIQIKEFNISKFKFCLIPFIPLFFIFLYKYSISTDVSNFMDGYWQNGFLSLNGFLPFIKENYRFFFYEGKYLIPLLPLAVIGFFIFAIQKDKINRIFICSFFGIILASILHLYPLLARTALYLVPFCIIFISKCFDFKINNKKIDKIISVIIILFVLLLTFLFQTKILFKNRLNIFLDRNKAVILQTYFVNNFDIKNDVLIIPRTSKTVYFYYSNHLNFHPENIMEAKTYDKKELKTILDRIEQGKTYWIYFIGFCSFKPKFTIINDELELRKIKNKLIKTNIVSSFDLYLIRL